MKRSFLTALIVGLSILGSAGPLAAQSGAPPDAARKVKASLIAEHPAIAPGATITVALREEIRDKWHTYWVNPGDAGAPTSIDWQLAAGWKASPIQWPYPVRLPVGPLMDYGYEKEVALLVDVTAPAGAKPGETAKLNAHAIALAPRCRPSAACRSQDRCLFRRCARETAPCLALESGL